MNTLIELFHTFPKRGEKTAMIYRTGVRRLTFSYEDLYRYSQKMAGWLQSKDIGTGDRIVLWGPNCPWWGVAFWGIVARGAIVVPVDFMSGRERAETIISLTEASLVIQSRLKIERLTDENCIFLEDLQYLLEEVPELTESAVVSPDHTAELVYTSGTTGNPKGVILTHANLMTNLHQVNRHVPVVTSEYTFLSLLPLSHMFEQMGGFITPLYRGSAIVYLPVLKPSAIMESLGEEDIYAIILVPRLLQLLRNSIERELEAKHLGGVLRLLLGIARKLSPAGRRRLFYPIQKKFGRHFTFFISGGAALDPVVAEFWQGLGFTVIEGYGLTECAPVVVANTMEEQIIGSVGKPLPEVEIKCTGNEILVRGPNVFPGYYQNAEATREAFTEDGWFKTGDVGELDAEGHLRIKGRSKELIVTGAGVNVYPDEIESILNKVRGVRESCVVGLDQGSGEEVHAVLLLDETGRPPQDIVQEANSSIDSLHQITGFSMWPEGDFPKTTTLKIQKFKVKQWLKKKDGGAGTTTDKLIALIARVTNHSAQEIVEGSFLVADLGLTSIARLELVNVLELEYRLDLDDSAIDQTTKVADLRAMIAKREKRQTSRRFRFWTNSRPIRWFRRMMDIFFHYPFMRRFIVIETKGLEHLANLQQPVLFISNHVSYLDQPAIMMALPPKWRYSTATAAWEEFFFPPQKPWWVRMWKRFTFEYATFALNAFPLPQSRGFRAALRHMGRLADRDLNILLFPEGERSRTGNLLPFQLGLGIMVRELRMPVVPIKITGLEYVFPRGAHWPKRGKVVVTFGEPLFFRQENAGEIVQRARRAVEKL